MPNILDYLTWRGDVPFSVSPPNEVDNYIHCKIGTLDFTGIVPENELYVPLPQAVEAYFAAGGAEKLGALSSPYIAPMVKRLPETVRFREVMLTGFRQVHDEKKTEQFSALTLRLPGGLHYVTFRGTDDTIVGWKEDCLLTVMDEIPAQRDALDYLTWAASVYPGKLAVGGHSKGGNLAMYAAAMAPESVQERIGNIYNNDGPGFQEKILQTEGYRRIKPRIKTILSQNAMVGTLLWQDCDYTVVKSTAALLGAHDGFTWETTPTGFVRCESLSPSARAFDRAMEEVLGGMSMDERKEFIEEFFGTLTATGAVTLSDLSARMLRETLRVARAVHQEPSLHKMVNETLEAMAKGYAAERNWSLSRLKLPPNPLRRKRTKKEEEENRHGFPRHACVRESHLIFCIQCFVKYGSTSGRTRSSAYGSTLAAAAAPIVLRSAASRPSVCTAPANAAASPNGTRNPAPEPSSRSACPLTRVSTQGSSMCIASITANGSPSDRLAETQISAAARAPRTSESRPGKRQRGATPSSPAWALHSSSSAPSPGSRR